jgi:hypothetical protein
MTLARLLAASLLLCSATLAQRISRDERTVLGDVYGRPCVAPAATPREPWRIIPSRTERVGSEQSPRSHVRGDLDRFVQPDADCIHYSKGYPFSMAVRSCGELSDADAKCHMARAYFMSIMPNGQPVWMDFPSNESNADPTCYTIRSYVVARDSKDSDSTHPAGYSTCLASDRYHVKTAEMREVVGDR